MKHEHPASDGRPYTAERLKVCPLCDALNASENAECFVCSWQGRFESGPVELEGGLARLFLDCPDLADAVLDGTKTPKRKRAERLKEILRRLVWRLPA